MVKASGRNAVPLGSAAHVLDISETNIVGAEAAVAIDPGQTMLAVRIDELRASGNAVDGVSCAVAA